MNKIPVGVLGASGYVGRELCSLISRHPRLTLVFATANEQCGTTVQVAGGDLTFVANEDAPLGDAELVFSALPHGSSKDWITRARETGARAVDLSADLRPGNGCEGIPYGLPEVTRATLSGAEFVANPGCYPTSVLLALAPLFARGIIPAGALVAVNSASGVTGAGNSPRREFLFAEVAGDYRAYGIGNTHRHLNEMRAVSRTLGADVDLVFTPHLLPVARGILTTIVVPLDAPLPSTLEPWLEMYAGEPFVEISAEPPALHDVVRRNVVRISAMTLAGTRQPSLLVMAALDNLLKGAAGQAVQNANLMLGLTESDGLPV